MRLIGMLLCLTAVAAHAGDYTRLFQRYWDMFWPDVPSVQWHLMESLVFAESSFRPDAVSPVGAQGLAQTLPGTLDDIARALSLEDVNPFDPETSIMAGTYYLKSHCWDYWTVPRTPREQLRVALGAYNAGAGNIDKAWGLARSRGLAGDWNDIAGCLPEITGPANAKQTTDYVPKILRRYDRRIAEQPPATPQEEVKRELQEHLTDLVAEVVPMVAAVPGGLAVATPKTEDKPMEAAIAALGVTSMTELMGHSGGYKLALLIVSILCAVYVPPYAFRRWDATLSYNTAEEIANGKILVFGLAALQVVGVFAVIIVGICLLH